MSFSVVIASHGAESWREVAFSRAYPSTFNQGAEILIEHDSEATRADVRNRLIAKASGDWIITLDADDELAPGYVRAMTRAARENCLLTPAISFVRKGRRQRPRFMPEVDLAKGNWMVVGTAAPRELMLEVGGWRTFTGSGVLNEWDDWDMWIRCTSAGAGIVKVPAAVYVAHVADSPHYARSRATSEFWLKEIRDANGIGAA